jgi:adenosylhomocysteine nucleosidase
MSLPRIARSALLFALVLAPLASRATTPTPTVPLVHGDTVPRVAVISAFEGELTKLRDSAALTGRIEVNGRTFWLGKLKGHDVALLLSGVSIVNATQTSEALLQRLRIRSIVFSGIAGGVNPGLKVGDITVPAQWGNYQESLFARKVDTGWDAGPQKGEFPNYGMIFPRPQALARTGRPADSLETRFWFPADSASLATARLVAASTTLRRRVTGSQDSLEHQPKIVVGGNGVSGPTFVDNAEYRTWVWNTFQADALDMETSAVAQVAWVHQVPFVAFRSLSDLAGGGQGKNEARTFGRLAADNSATAVLSYLNRLPKAK